MKLRMASNMKAKYGDDYKGGEENIILGKGSLKKDSQKRNKTVIL
jgi:hypothetical protein